MTVIFKAKAPLAHTVSLLQSHKTCQLRKKEEKKADAAVPKQHLWCGWGLRDWTHTLSLPAAADPSDYADAARGERNLND